MDKKVLAGTLILVMLAVAYVCLLAFRGEDHNALLAIVALGTGGLLGSVR